MCEDGYGAFLSASNILTVSQSGSIPAISTSPREKLLISSTQSKSDRDFYLDDHVVVFDKDGKRVPGVAKWASPGKDHGWNCYIIGIKTVRDLDCNFCDVIGSVKRRVTKLIGDVVEAHC